MKSKTALAIAQLAEQGDYRLATLVLIDKMVLTEDEIEEARSSSNARANYNYLLNLLLERELNNTKGGEHVDQLQKELDAERKRP